MDLRKITLEEFLGEVTHTSDPADDFPQFLLAYGPLIGGEVMRIDDAYSLHIVGANRGNLALLDNDDPIGFYVGDILILRGDRRRMGLSAPLIIEASRHRPMPTTRTLGETGKKALISAYRVAQRQDQPWWPKEA